MEKAVDKAQAITRLYSSKDLFMDTEILISCNLM